MENKDILRELQNTNVQNSENEDFDAELAAHCFFFKMGDNGLANRINVPTK